MIETKHLIEWLHEELPRRHDLDIEYKYQVISKLEAHDIMKGGIEKLIKQCHESSRLDK